MQNRTAESGIFDSICGFLDRRGVDYETLEHSPASTSADSAAVRGDDLKVGAKAILLKIDKAFVLFVLKASMRIDSAKIKSALGARSTRFATEKELAEITGGLVPGSVPPFGLPVLQYPVYVDESMRENQKMAFNAGSLTRSVRMDVSDYLACTGYPVIRFAAD